MRSFNYLLLALLAISACRSAVPYSYDYTPVLLHLNKYKQHDTIGFNLVGELPKLLYAKIMSGDIPLWDSPDKQVRIEKGDFMSMEERAKVPFVETEELFIHQVWNIFQRRFTAGTLGFSFAGTTKDGRPLSYGFVDAADVLVLMRDRIMPCNANGSEGLSYWHALESMKFHFNLVQFGKNDFKENPMHSFRLKAQAISDPHVRRSFYQIPQRKEIEYRITPPHITSNPENGSLYKAIDQSINENRQILLNAGGMAFLDYLSPKPWKVDRVSVVEHWTKQEFLPLQELQELRIFLQGGEVVLNTAALEEMGLRIQLQQPEEYLSGKQFSFTLLRINAQEIPAHASTRYYDALLQRDWNKIN